MEKERREDHKERAKDNAPVEECIEGTKISEQTNEEENIINNGDEESEVKLLKEQLQAKQNELSQYIDLLQRVKAEFDNFKKRSIREKEQLNIEIKGDLIAELLPVIDNLIRAVSSESSESENILDGVKMIMKQLMDILSKQGLEEIEASGKQFDPEYHNAVMHIEDESYGPNSVVEVFQKGYKIKDKVIRHSMVKVAN